MNSDIMNRHSKTKRTRDLKYKRSDDNRLICADHWEILTSISSQRATSGAMNAFQARYDVIHTIVGSYYAKVEPHYLYLKRNPNRNSLFGMNPQSKQQSAVAKRNPPKRKK